MSNNHDLLARRNRFVAKGVATAHPIGVARALGARLWDVDGNEYLDFVGGIGALNVGHNHPRVIEAVRAQLERLTHAAFQVAMYEPYVELAERLSGLLGAGAHKTLLLTAGIEAIENAIKMARAYTNRPAVVAFAGGFHGRTLLGMTLTAASHSYRQNFGPFAPEIYHSPFPYEYRGWTTERALDSLTELFETRLPPNRVAALIIEPQLGEGGFVPAPFDFLRELRRLTKQHGIVLILDEIQSGFGRTGKMFGFQHAGIEPDLVALAKSLAGGMPLSAVVGKAEIMDAPLAGALGGTYGGAPLACAAALAVLDVFREERLLERAESQGQQLHKGLGKLAERFPQIGDMRGLGPMLGLEFVRDRKSKEPDAKVALRLLERARAHGLLLLRSGPMKNVIRILAPLVTTEDEVARALTILEKALEEAVEGIEKSCQ